MTAAFKTPLPAIKYYHSIQDLHSKKHVELSAEEASQLFKVTWVDYNIDAPSEAIPQSHGYEYLGIVDMGIYGKAVFAIKDIPQGTILCYYAGNSKIEKNSPYQLKTSSVMVNAREYRNFGGFMQHLTSWSEITTYTINSRSISLADIATKNIQISSHKGQIMMTADRGILMNDIVGFPYTSLGVGDDRAEDDYWLHENISPQIFSWRGEPLTVQYGYHILKLRSYTSFAEEHKMDEDSEICVKWQGERQELISLAHKHERIFFGQDNDFVISSDMLLRELNNQTSLRLFMFARFLTPGEKPDFHGRISVFATQTCKYGPYRDAYPFPHHTPFSQ